ncbi:MAG: STAS domain-containing protein, partial [candidate division KSB1 bacterium]
MKIEHLAGGSISILRPSGSLIGSQETEHLRHELERLHEQGNRRAIIDLGRVPYLNSAGLGVLIAAFND